MSASPDVVVVGAGAGGPVVAFELARRGVEVALVEGGPRLDPTRDYSRLEHQMGSMFHGRLRWGPGDLRKPPWMRRRSGIGLILQASGVGGTTRHYNAMATRPYPASIDADWPFDHAELLPDLEAVEAFLPVARVDCLAPKDALFAQGCEVIGLRRDDSPTAVEDVWGPSHNAILPVAKLGAEEDFADPSLDGCTMCGHCLIGCAHPIAAPLERKAKRSTDVSYVPAALRTGRCLLHADLFATAVLWEAGEDGRARARGVRCRRTLDGEWIEIPARVVVLAGGAIETPRLFLNSSLPDPHDQVGRSLTNHYQDFVTGFFDRDVHPDAGQVSMARADFPGHGRLWSEGYGPWGFSVALAGSGGGFWDDPVDGEPWDFAGRSLGASAMDVLERYRQTLTIAISADDERHPANRVTRARDWPPDEHGFVPWILYRPTPESRARQDWLARKAAEILRAAGATRIHRSRVSRAVMAHMMGTMRMGNDPRTSVTDAFGESHSVRELFVADASALPNGVGGVPPSLTTQALARRTADAIARRLGAA